MQRPAQSDSAPTPTGGTVVLGVSGSIAAYKAADLTSRLVKNGIHVHVIMTRAATRLVQPQTFLTLSRNPVITDLWEIPDWRPGHVALAERADLFVVAPATGNVLAKLAHGIADDALTTFALTHQGPLLAAPAMNPRMWAHPAVRENTETLRRRGARILGPDSGPVACGDRGPGRMLEPDNLERTVRAHLAARILPPHPPRRFLVTAGPTRESIDPVRFITNRSSGKMGDAVARVAAAAGHPTTLITGPTALPDPPELQEVYRVNSAAELAAAVLERFEQTDVLVMTAAVADFRPANPAPEKIHKNGRAGLTLELESTQDILAAVAKRRKPGQTLVGFAAETSNLAQSARNKLESKELDWILANDVSRPDAGFGGDRNGGLLLSASREIRLPIMDKFNLAARLLQIVLGHDSPQE